MIHSTIYGTHIRVIAVVSYRYLRLLHIVWPKNGTTIQIMLWMIWSYCYRMDDMELLL